MEAMHWALEGTEERDMLDDDDDADPDSIQIHSVVSTHTNT